MPADQLQRQLDERVRATSADARAGLHVQMRDDAIRLDYSEVTMTKHEPQVRSY